MAPKLRVVLIAVLSLTTCWMLPVDPVEYDYRVSQTDVTLTFTYWPASTPSEYYYGDGNARLWVMGVMDGPPAGEAVGAVRNDWGGGQDPTTPNLPGGAFLAFSEECLPADLPSEVNVTIGGAASHILAVVETEDGSGYFSCLPVDGGPNYTVSIWWRDRYYGSDPLPDHLGVRYPREITDLAFAGGSLFVAISEGYDDLVVLDADAGTVEEYEIVYTSPHRVTADPEGGIAYIGFYTEDVIAVFDLESRTFLASLPLPASSSSPDLHDLEFVSGGPALAVLRDDLAVEQLATWRGAAIPFGSAAGSQAVVDESRDAVHTLDPEWGSTSRIRTYTYATDPPSFVGDSDSADFTDLFAYCGESDRIIACVEEYSYLDWETTYTAQLYDPDGLWPDATLFTTTNASSSVCTVPGSGAILYVDVTDDWDNEIVMVAVDLVTGNTLGTTRLPDARYGTRFARSADGETIVLYSRLDDGDYTVGAFHIFTRTQAGVQ